MSDEQTPAADPAPPAWYCPGCGERFFGPGTCANDHAPLELLLDPELAGAAENPPSPGAGDIPPTEDVPEDSQQPQRSEAPAETPAKPFEPELSVLEHAKAHIKTAFELLAQL